MMERINLNERAPLGKTNKILKKETENKNLEETLLKSNKDKMTSKSDLLSKKTM